MKTSIPSIFTTRRTRRFAGLPCALALLVSLSAAASVLAENPWTSAPLGWSSGPTGNWSSWDSTTGGTFGSPHHSHSAGLSAAPLPRVVRNPEIDPVMIKAGSIAEHRVQPRSTSFCWRYVKEALVAAGGVQSYPQTAYAKDAGRDLVQNHGFVQLAVRSAEQAPVGSVLVYGGGGAGHVELRTTRGFVSDYYCNRPSGLPFIGAFTRLEKHRKDIQTAQVGGTVGSGS